MFKTIDGELKAFNKTILSTQNNLKNLQTERLILRNGSYNKNNFVTGDLGEVHIAQPQTVSNFTKLNNAFNVYNNNLTKSTGLQNAYIKSVGTQNQTLGNYLAGLKGAPASFGGYIAALTKARLATIGLQAASIALNMALTMGVAVAISALFKGIDYLIHRTEKMQEALQNSVDEFNTVTDELKSLEEELKTTTERLEELQKLADNGTISVAEEAELETLKKTNKELARKIALKQQEQAQEARDVLKDSKKNANSTVTSKYKGHSNSSGERFDYENLTPDEELYEAIKAYETNSKAAIANEGTNLEGWYEDQTESAKNRIEEMYALISPTIDAYEDLINAGIELKGEDKTRYEQLKKSQDAYLAYIYTLNGTKEAFEGLNAEQQRNVLLNRLVKQGLSEDIAKAIIGSISDEDLSKYWDKNFSFVPPEMKDGETAEEYGKRYAEAWAKGLEEGVKDANEMLASLSDLKSASEGISTLQKAFKELSDEGYITTESISKIQEATKLSGEEWNSYQSKLLNAKAGTAEFNQVMTDLTYKILDNTFAGKDLTEVTEEQIAAVLRENGVTNASAVAHDYATRAKEAARIKTELLAGATYSEVIELAREAAQAGITGQAFLDLVVDIGILNNTALDPTQKVQALQEIGFFANWTAQQIANIGRVSRWSASGKNGLAVYDEDGNLKGVELYDDYTPPAYTPPTIPTFTGGSKSGSSGGGGSSSAKNEALDNYLKDAENRYKIHQDETKYINDLNYALNNLVKTEDERLDVTGKINEAYRDLADNRIKDLEHQIDLTKELKGENADVTAQYNEIQKVAHEEAERLRAMGYDDNSNEIQDLQKTWWDAQDKKLDWRWNNSTNWIEERKNKGDWSLFGDSEVQAWERVIKWLEQDYPNALDKIKEAKNNLVDARWEHSNNWIDERNTYNDWALFNDSEVDAWERVVKWLKKDYPDDINKIKEAEQNLFEARKEQFDKANDFGSSILDSRKTLLQSYFDVTNSIAEAQHEINKELETSKTMYEWLDKDTRQLLFNQEDYNTLSEELLDIQYKADKLRWQYERDLNNSTLETVESITSQYEMQYETLMKSYEIAKADLEIAKKKQQLNNVLNERNVRMFINGQWQWVANTEDVINAKAELADAEYAKQVEEAGLTQQESINNLTKQQDELSVVIKKFENGVITLGEAVDAARNAIGNLPNALNSMYNNASSGGTSKSSNRVSRLHPSVVGGSSYSTKFPNVQGNYTVNGVQYSNKYAEGTRYTSGGMTLMGEEGFEAFINSNGHLIPINQPTIGNIPSGGIVFNTEQMSNLRSLWDLSNFNINPDRSYVNRQPQHIDQSQDNRIIINGMTVDSGSSDGQALINAIRRYVGNH